MQLEDKFASTVHWCSTDFIVVKLNKRCRTQGVPFAQSISFILKPMSQSAYFRTGWHLSFQLESPLLPSSFKFSIPAKHHKTSSMYVSSKKMPRGKSKNIFSKLSAKKRLVQSPLATEQTDVYRIPTPLVHEFI